MALSSGFDGWFFAALSRAGARRRGIGLVVRQIDGMGKNCIMRYLIDIKIVIRPALTSSTGAGASR